MDVDNEFARGAMENFGAFILGRNMFGPVRVWRQAVWKDGGATNPPCTMRIFVLTH